MIKEAIKDESTAEKVNGVVDIKVDIIKSGSNEDNVQKKKRITLIALRANWSLLLMNWKTH